MDFNQLMACHENNPRVYKQLLNLIKENHVTPFIGSGLSTWASYPTWKELLLEMSSHNGSTFKQEITDILSGTDHHRYEKAASQIKKKLGEAVFWDTINEQFTPDNLNQENHNRPLYQELLPKIFKTQWITTNFDRCIEFLFDNKIDRITPESTESAERILNAMQSNKRLLIKTHGDICDLPNLVLTEEQYDKAYFSNSPMQKILQNIFERNPVLFIGCSLDQDRIIDVLSKCNTPLHFAILQLPKETLNSENPYTPIFEDNGNEVPEWESRRTLLSNQNVRCIWYPAVDSLYSQNMHDEALSALFTQLSQDLGVGRTTETLPTDHLRWLDLMRKSEEDGMTKYLLEQFSNITIPYKRPKTSYYDLQNIEDFYYRIRSAHHDGVKSVHNLLEEANKALQYIQEIKKHETISIYKFYLLTREADFYFYQGYPYLRNIENEIRQIQQMSESAKNSYQKLINVMSASIKIHFEIADELRYEEIKPGERTVPNSDKYGKNRFLFGYVCNAIAEANRLLLNGKRLVNPSSDELSRLSEEAFHFSRLAKDFWKENSTYHRNFGCIAEPILGIGDLSVSNEVFAAYTEAVSKGPKEWKNYKTYLSYIDKWINRHIGTLDSSTGYLSKKSMVDIASENAANNLRYYDAADLAAVEKRVPELPGENGQMQNALINLKEHAEAAIRLFQSNYEGLIYISIYYRNLYIILASRENDHLQEYADKARKFIYQASIIKGQSKSGFFEAVAQQIFPEKYDELTKSITCYDEQH